MPWDHRRPPSAANRQKPDLVLPPCRRSMTDQATPTLASSHLAAGPACRFSQRVTLFCACETRSDDANTVSRNLPLGTQGLVELFKIPDQPLGGKPRLDVPPTRLPELPSQIR